MKNRVKGQTLLIISICLVLLVVFGFNLASAGGPERSPVSISAFSSDCALPPVGSRISENLREIRTARGDVWMQKAAPLAPEPFSPQASHVVPVISIFSHAVIDSIFKSDIQQACKMLDIPPPLYPVLG